MRKDFVGRCMYGLLAGVSRFGVMAGTCWESLEVEKVRVEQP